MTQNQIAYQALLENKRHNRSTEGIATAGAVLNAINPVRQLENLIRKVGK